jgi:hypothetical protein
MCPVSLRDSGGVVLGKVAGVFNIGGKRHRKLWWKWNVTNVLV